MLALVLAVLVILGLNGRGPLDLRSHEARQDLAAALAQYAKTPVVHELGAFSRDGHRFQLDITLDRASGDSQGTVVADGQQVQYRYVGGRGYALAGPGFWASQGTLAGFYASRWVTGPDLLSDLSTSALSRSLSLLDLARPGVTFDSAGPPTRIGRVPAVPLGDANGQLYVSRTPPVRFLRLVSSASYRTSDGVTDVRVDLDYPAALNVQAPSPFANTDDPATLPAQYVVDDSSLQHGRDCDVGSTCTVTVSVVNQRGPQVGGASADVHLIRDDGSDLGSCTTAIRPAAHGQSQSIGCTVSGSAWVAFTRVGGRYRAEVTVHNPLYDG